MKFQREDLAWGAGLFDGEGSFFAQTNGSGCCADLSMTDKKIVEKFKGIIGVGVIRVRPNSPHKTFYEYRLCKFEHVQHLAAILWPWLGKYKKQKAIKLLMNARQGRVSPGYGPRVDKTHCINGHKFTEENTYLQKGRGYMVCRECRKKSALKHYHRTKKLVRGPHRKASTP